MVAGRVHRRGRRRVHRADPPPGRPPPGRARSTCSTWGRARARWPGWRRASPGWPGWSGSTSPGPSSTWPSSAGGGPGLRPGRGRRPPVPVGVVRRRHRLPRLRAHRRRRRGHRRGRPGPAPGRAVPLLPQPPPAPGAGLGWIDDHILEEQYWRIGPYLTEDTTLEEVEKDVFLPFVHRPLSRYVNALADAGLRHPPHGGAAPAPRLPRPGPGVPRRGHHPPPPLPAGREAPPVS